MYLQCVENVTLNGVLTCGVRCVYGLYDSHIRIHILALSSITIHMARYLRGMYIFFWMKTVSVSKPLAPPKSQDPCMENRGPISLDYMYMHMYAGVVELFL